MPNPFNQLLAGLSGAATGYGQQQATNVARQRQSMLDQDTLKDNASQRALRDAQAAAATEGTWSQPFAAVGPDGSPIMAQQHRQTGELRPATMGQTAPRTPSPLSSRMPTPPEPGDSQDMVGDQTPLPQSPTQGQASGGTLRPYVKPTAPTGPLMGSPEWKDAQRFRASLVPTPSPTIQVLPGLNGGPAQGVVTHGAGLGSTIDIPGVDKSAPGGGANAAKAKTYVDLMEQSLPEMTRLSAKVRPAMISAAVKFPTAANGLLNQDEQLYMQAARSFLAGVLHQESGARLSAEQWKIGLERYFPTMGDSPETKDAKIKSANSLVADRRREVGGAQPTTPHESGAPSGDITLNGKPSLGERAKQLQKSGYSKAAAMQQLRDEGYDLATGQPAGTP